MTYFIEFIKSPLNILIIILLLFSLFIVLGTYKEGFTSTEITGQTYTDVSGNIYINGTEITDTNFTGPNGNNAEIISVNGDYEIIVTDKSGNKTIYNFNMPTTSNSTSSSSNSSSSNSSSLYSTTFYGQNGGTAQIITGPNGSNLIQITNTNGQLTTFSPNNPYPSSSSIYAPPPMSYPPTSYPPTSYPPTSYPPTSYPPTSYSPTSYPPTSYPPTNNVSTSSSYSPYSSYSEESTSPYNQTSSPYTQSSPSSSYDYSSSLPPGIPISQIPPGQEDLYILKSEIVPPVCPAPVPAVHCSTEKCAPCPPCARCPQPNFECKKVPNYSSSNNDLPMASMSPYSTYGS